MACARAFARKQILPGSLEGAIRAIIEHGNYNNNRRRKARVVNALEQPLSPVAGHHCSTNTSAFVVDVTRRKATRTMIHLRVAADASLHETTRPPVEFLNQCLLDNTWLTIEAPPIAVLVLVSRKDYWSVEMKLTDIFGVAVALLPSLSHAASWSFKDATLSVATKGEEPFKQKLSPDTPSSSPPASLTASNTLKVVLTATEDGVGKRPHQAFLTIAEQDSGLEESFAFVLKSDGKGKSQKDLPFQFLASSKPLQASITLGTFGDSVPLRAHTFDIDVHLDPVNPQAIPSPPERYASKPEIHHIFRADPRSPPKLVSVVFTLAIIVTLPVLLGAWLLLGGNISHVGKALSASPVAHSLFLGSVLAMEGIFFLYYASWTLFQTLPAAAVVGAVAYVSGSRALTEVQERRFAGAR
ncbi:hypothetical protein MRB53_041473 [Persea americana]|nr:hypothetical protein MRB53_041473 [Persea americana]